MSVLKQMPFVKLIIPFVFGISLVTAVPQVGAYALLPLILVIVLYFIFSLYRTSILAKRFAGLSILLVFLCFGSWLSHNKDPKNQKQNLEKAGLSGLYLIRISEIPQIKLKTVKIQARVIGRILDGKMMKANEFALFYFDKKISVPKPGDELIVKCTFKTIPEPENPYQFNYKRFLRWQGIYYQSFIRNPNSVLKTGENKASLFQNLSYNGNQYLKKLFHKNIKDSTALGVTEALIFGYKEDLPKDLVESYSRTGTLHVLAVSGLHVAVVFLMLANFLWFLDKRRFGVWLKTGIVIICIWVYCILTGMSPSIIRAGLMISIVLIGKALHRQTNIFNTVAFSAFLILLINPFWILNLGFQLSFAAVLGIVYLQHYILPLWVPPNWFMRQVWNILVISICAQIATFPLSLYYFNQFPNYFLLSNLIIIPLTTIIIYTGIGMVVFSKLSPLLLPFSWLTEHLVILTNYMVTRIEKFPFSFIDGVKLNTIQLCALYICIGCLIFWLVNANKKGLISALICLTLIISIASFDKLRLQKQKHLVIFNIPNQNALLASDGRKSLLISDNLKSGKQMFYMRGWLIQNRLWPINKEYDFNGMDTMKIRVSEMNLIIDKGVLFFKGSKLNLSCNTLGKFTGTKSHILPIYFNWKSIYADNMCDTVYIGQHKSKRLQKKVKYFLSKYHNCVIYDNQYIDLMH
jgi:competence protein ComEC